MQDKREIEIGNISKKAINRRSFLAFASFLGLYGIGYKAWDWLYNQPLDGGLLGGIQTPLRTVLDINEKIFTNEYEQSGLAKEYPVNQAVKRPRVNGDVGLDVDFNLNSWWLNVTRHNGSQFDMTLDLIKTFPKTEVTFNFKCIEGWSQITHFGGVKFSDFMARFELINEQTLNYVGLATPDESYYVGIDMPSALHPQTLLCYEMNGEPLPNIHGGPLRLIIPVKYGVKHLKRIGSIYFSNDRPPDYWAERGYDYYLGH